MVTIIGFWKWQRKWAGKPKSHIHASENPVLGGNRLEPMLGTHQCFCVGPGASGKATIGPKVSMRRSAVEIK